MRKLIYIIFFVPAFILFGCQDKQESVKKEVFKAAKDIMDSTFSNNGGTVDEFTPLDVDTLTPYKDSFIVLNVLDQVKDIIKTSIKSEQKSIQNNVDLVKAYSYLDKGLMDTYKGKVKSAIKETKPLFELYDQILKRQENIFKLDSLKLIDTTTFTGYIVHFNILGADDKGNEFRQDTAELFLNKYYRVINWRQEIISNYKRIMEME